MPPKQPAYISEQYRHLTVFWADIAHMMLSKPHALASVGYMREFMSSSKKIFDETVRINEDLKEFNEHLTEYYKQITDTWNDAQKKVNLKVTKLPQDAEQIEAYKRVWIDIFDNDFTDLFDSARFGDNYGKLVSKELDLTRRWEAVADTILKSAHLPNKSEVDEIYQEIHMLKKRIRKMESEIRRMRPGENEK